MKKAFVTGWPINHSKSPDLHGYWIKYYGLDASYQAIAVAEEDFPEFLETIEANGFVGGNITLPHKETTYKLISNKDAAAERIGAANTIWFEDGKIKAGNTDSYGFSANLDEYAPQWRDGKHAVVLGAGGASRAIIHALQNADFDRIDILNRTVSRAEDLAEHFGKGCTGNSLHSLSDNIDGADLLVNTTSLGMVGKDNGTIPDLKYLKKDAVVTDIVYTPLKTPLLLAAEAKGNPIVDGLGMLLHQAVPGFERWFGIRPEVTQELRKHILALL